MDGCPFCVKIDNWDFEESYASRTVVRMEPLNPVTPGHMLFVPGYHSIHPDAGGIRSAMAYAEKYAGAKGEDFNLITSSGPSATQTIEHVHVHYVPRRPGDGLMLPWTRPSELKAELLREAIGGQTSPEEADRG